MNFRLLNTGMNSASYNMAIDEAVIGSVSTGASAPTLRLYGWSPAAISIGYFQSLEEEVDTAACAREGIDVVRRVTGGGAVFHEHEITYSIHIPEKSGLVPMGILESYGKICGGIVKGLAHLNLKAQFVPLNDIVLEHEGRMRKISGNAQTRKAGVILQHGTILLKVDIEKMFSLLKVPSEKMKGKLIEDIKQRVTSVSAVHGNDVSFERMAGILTRGFSEEFSQAQFETGALSSSEKETAERLAKEKYGANGWNKKR